MNTFNSIIILGPTASGKTKLAAHLAQQKQGTVLSFESRQVYTGLNIGTGKDLNEYTINGESIPYELIDICGVNTNFHSYEFVKKYIHAFDKCQATNRLPILCGGNGLYFDLVLKEFQNINIPNDKDLRDELEKMEHEKLIQNLKSFPEEIIKTADTSTIKRTIRALEIAKWKSQNHHEKIPYPKLKPILFSILSTVEERNIKIKKRLEQRIQDGLIEEVKLLLEQGIPKERLIYLGLEYRIITEYIYGLYDLKKAIELLETAIIQYAKRQMTWFRKLERDGYIINWIDSDLALEKKLEYINSIMG